MAKKIKKDLSFEEAISEVELSIASLEKGETTLDESLEAYKRGTQLLSYCLDILEKAKQEVFIYEQGEYKKFEEGVE